MTVHGVYVPWPSFFSFLSLIEMPRNDGIFSKETEEGYKRRTLKNTQALLCQHRYEEKEEKMFCYLGGKVVNQNDQGGIFPDAFQDKLQLHRSRVGNFQEWAIGFQVS